MRSYEIATEIPAQREVAWAALVRLAAWPEWNRLVPHAEGTVAEGGELFFRIRQADGRFHPHRATVIALEAPARILLAANVGFAWLLRMEHAFCFEDSPAGCRLVQRWEVSGLLAWLLWPFLEESFSRFALLGEDLSARVQGR
jgi:uncharacterized protein YndB with AHSA1/START domain